MSSATKLHFVRDINSEPLSNFNHWVVTATRARWEPGIFLRGMVEAVQSLM